MKKKYKEEVEEEPSLLDVFKQGDRVKQVYYDPNGDERIYYGTIINIKKHCIAVQWDKIDDSNSKKDETYRVFHVSEVINGDEYYSPIVKEK